LLKREGRRTGDGEEHGLLALGQLGKGRPVRLDVEQDGLVGELVAGLREESQSAGA